MPKIFQYLAPMVNGNPAPRAIDSDCAAEMDLVDPLDPRRPRYCGATTESRPEWGNAYGGCSRPVGHLGVHVCGDRRRGAVYARWIVV